MGGLEGCVWGVEECGGRSKVCGGEFGRVVGGWGR